VSFVISDVKKVGNNQYQIQFNATKDTRGGGVDYSWTNSLYQRLELQDARGNKFPSWGSSWGSSGANHVTMTLTYTTVGPGNPGDPTKFIYQPWVPRGRDGRFESRPLPWP